MTNEPIIANEMLTLMPKVKALLEGMKAGKTLQFKRTPNSEWVDVEDATLDLFNRIELYRLKTVPKRIWVNEYPAGYNTACESESAARESASPTAIRVAVPFVEVID